MTSDHESNEARDEALNQGLAPEVSRRVAVILDAVEQEAEQLRLESQAEARQYLHASRDRADQLVEVRQQRIGQLTDELIEKAEAVISRLEGAAPVRAGFDNLVRALGNAAERLSQEAEQTHDDYEPRSFHSRLASPPPPPVIAPPPLAGPQPQSDVAAGADPVEQVRPPQPPISSPAPPPPAIPASDRPTGTGASPESVGSHDLDEGRRIAIQLAAQGWTCGQVRSRLQQRMGIGNSRRILDEIFGAGSADEAIVPWCYQTGG